MRILVIAPVPVIMVMVVVVTVSLDGPGLRLVIMIVTAGHVGLPMGTDHHEGGGKAKNEHESYSDKIFYSHEYFSAKVRPVPGGLARKRRPFSCTYGARERQTIHAQISVSKTQLRDRLRKG
jgi:hypothetical protein